jgi:hypothetical protein
LLEAGWKVHAVEPNAPMREAAEADLAGFPHFCSLTAMAEATGLPDAFWTRLPRALDSIEAEYRKISALRTNRNLETFFLSETYQKRTFYNPQEMNLGALRGRFLGSSCAPSEEDPPQPASFGLERIPSVWGRQSCFR